MDDRALNQHSFSYLDLRQVASKLNQLILDYMPWVKFKLDEFRCFRMVNNFSKH